MNMSEEEKEDQYVLTFKNGALVKLKALAQKYGISEDELDKVVSKGLKVLDLPEDGKIVFKVGSDTYNIDLKNI